MCTGERKYKRRRMNESSSGSETESHSGDRSDVKTERPVASGAVHLAPGPSPPDDAVSGSAAKVSKKCFFFNKKKNSKHRKQYNDAMLNTGNKNNIAIPSQKADNSGKSSKKRTPNSKYSRNPTQNLEHLCGEGDSVTSREAQSYVCECHLRSSESYSDSADSDSSHVPSCICAPPDPSVDEQVAAERLMNLPSQYHIIRDNASPGVARALDWETDDGVYEDAAPPEDRGFYSPASEPHSIYIPTPGAPTLLRICRHCCEEEEFSPAPVTLPATQPPPRPPPPPLQSTLYSPPGWSLPTPYNPLVRPLRLLPNLGPMQGLCGVAPFAPPPFRPCGGPPTSIGDPVAQCPVHGLVRRHDAITSTPTLSKRKRTKHRSEVAGRR